MMLLPLIPPPVTESFESLSGCGQGQPGVSEYWHPEHAGPERGFYLRPQKQGHSLKPTRSSPQNKAHYSLRKRTVLGAK